MPHWTEDTVHAGRFPTSGSLRTGYVCLVALCELRSTMITQPLIYGRVLYRSRLGHYQLRTHVTSRSLLRVDITALPSRKRRYWDSASKEIPHTLRNPKYPLQCSKKHVLSLFWDRDIRLTFSYPVSLTLHFNITLPSASRSSKRPSSHQNTAWHILRQSHHRLTLIQSGP